MEIPGNKHPPSREDLGAALEAAVADVHLLRATLADRDKRIETLEAEGHKLALRCRKRGDVAAQNARDRDAHIKRWRVAEARERLLKAALRPIDVDNLNDNEVADVERFKNAMLAKLNTTTQIRCFEGMEDRGGKTWLERQTWVGSSTNFILRLKKEVTELERARTNDEIAAEAVDVANFAMMVFAQAAALCDGDKGDGDETSRS